MRVLIVSPCFGAFGGIEAFVCALAKELHALPGVNPVVCFKKTAGFRLDALLEKNAAATDVPVVFADRASKELMHLIREADIVHCQNPCVDVALFARMFRK